MVSLDFSNQLPPHPKHFPPPDELNYLILGSSLQLPERDVFSGPIHVATIRLLLVSVYNFTSREVKEQGCKSHTQ